MSKIKIFGLGGLNENGKNMYVVEVDDEIIVLDAGLKYADDTMLGVDYILPNYDYLKKNKSKIKGFLITHGHDKHMGALADIAREFKGVPIYATKFTSEVIKQDFEADKVPLTDLVTIETHAKFKVGSIDIFPVSLTHSVPDAVGYAIYTKDGIIFYTGNFVFDPTMRDDYMTDIGKLAYLGKQGVLCLMSESLYADKTGFTTPNHRMTSKLTEIFSRHNERIIYNISQTQLYRMQELFDVVTRMDRRVLIMGKYLEKIILNSIDTGYLKFDKKRIANIKNINDEGIVVVVTDEREKPFSNINRVVNGYDKFLKLSKEDTLIFASPIFDGMERRASTIFDRIAMIGSNFELLSGKNLLEHHASSEDLMLMLDMMSPKYYFPVIGEYRHQVENGLVAEKLGIAKENILLRTNGVTVKFEDGKLIDDDEVIKVEDILVDGKSIGDIGEVVLKDREMLSDDGVVVISVTLDRRTKKILAGPFIETLGFLHIKNNAKLIKDSEKIVKDVLKELIKPHFADFNDIRYQVRDRLGKYLYKETEGRPMILVTLQEV